MENNSGERESPCEILTALDVELCNTFDNVIMSYDKIKLLYNELCNVL